MLENAQKCRNEAYVDNIHVCLASCFDDSPEPQLLHRAEIHWHKFFYETETLFFAVTMHIETLPVQMTDFQLLSAEVAVT